MDRDGHPIYEFALGDEGGRVLMRVAKPLDARQIEAAAKRVWEE